MTVLVVLLIVACVVFGLRHGSDPRIQPPRQPLQSRPPRGEPGWAPYAAYGEGERLGREAAERDAAEWRMANDPGESDGA